MNNNTMFGSPILRECCQQNFLTIPPKPCQPDTPWVCGEGEIIPIYYLDGSVQFYFVPKTCYTQCNQFMGCNQMAIPNNNAAWLVSGIGQRVQNLNWQLPQEPIYTQQHIVVPPYQLKFHRDSCTSTTDLHYFIPKHNAICFQRAETAVQATNKINLLTPNNKVIDINITTEERSKKKAKRPSSSCACAETPQKSKCHCSPSRPCSSQSKRTENELSSSDDSETTTTTGDDDSCDEGCSGNKSKTSKIQKPKAKSKKKKKQPQKNKSVKFVKRTDCSDTDMFECDQGGNQQIGKSEYYSFSRKRY